MAATVTFIKTILLGGAQMRELREDYQINWDNDAVVQINSKLGTLDLATCMPIGTAGDAATLSVGGGTLNTDGSLSLTNGTVAIGASATSISQWFVSLHGR